jgi:hypothetical protein
VAIQKTIAGGKKSEASSINKSFGTVFKLPDSQLKTRESFGPAADFQLIQYSVFRTTT